eukprot:jgi/Galph1/5596/GphlegSOOS_G4278.1
MTKERGSYNGKASEDFTYLRGYSGDQEDVFFDTLSDDFVESSFLWQGFDEDKKAGLGLRKEEFVSSSQENKRKGRKKKKRKGTSAPSTAGENSNSGHKLAIERSIPRPFGKNDCEQKESESRFFAQLKTLKDSFITERSSENLLLLNFSSCRVGKKKAQIVSTVLSGVTVPSVTASLDFADNFLKNAGTRVLAEAFAKTKMSVILLNLSNNRVGDEGVSFLGKSLRSQPLLTNLSLANNEIGASGVEALIESLKGGSKIETIDLSSNRIGDKGAFHIAQLLETCQCSLRCVNISNNCIGEDGLLALVRSLGNWKQVSELQRFHIDISNNEYSKQVANDVERLKNSKGWLEIMTSEDALREEDVSKTNGKVPNDIEEGYCSTGEGWCNSESVQDIFACADIIERWLTSGENSIFCPEEAVDSYDTVLRYLDEELNANANDEVLSPNQLFEESNELQYRLRVFDNDSDITELPPAVRATLQLVDVLLRPLFHDLFEGCFHLILTPEEELTCIESLSQEDALTANRIRSQSSVIFPRLRYYRYKCVEVVWKLVCFRFQCIDDLLSHQGVLSRCLELLVEFPHSNCLQSLLLKIIEEAFNAERKSDTLLWSLIRPWCFVSNSGYHILHTIRDVYQINSNLVEKFPKIGNISALSTVSRFARLIVDKCRENVEVRVCLETYSEWSELQQEIFPKLLEMSSSYALGDEQVGLGGKKPSRTNFGPTPQIDWAAIFRGFPGTGILGLPVTLHNCGFFPFFIIFTLILCIQIAVVYSFVELLQRTDISLLKLSSKSLEVKEQPRTDPLQSNLYQTSSNLERTDESHKLTSMSSSLVHTDQYLSEDSQPVASLFTMSFLYLKNPSARFVFEGFVLVHFVSIMTSYALAAPQSFQQLLGLNANQPVLIIIPFAVLCSLLTCFVLPRILNIVSFATAVKGGILASLICLVFVVSLRVGHVFENHFNHIFDSFLIGTISLGSVVNVMPVTWSQLGYPKDARVVKLYRLSVVLGVLTCYILCTVWCLAVLLVVPQSSSSDSLEGAYKLGQISTVPLVSSLQKLDTVPRLVSFLVNVFICVSVTVSFVVMGSGLKNALDGLSYRWTRMNVNSGFSEFLNKCGDNRIRVSLYFVLFGLIVVLAASNPHSFLNILEGFTSVCLNMEAGFFIGWMLLSSISVTNSMELVLPLRKNTMIILGYTIIPFFTFASLAGVVRVLIS